MRKTVGVLLVLATACRPGTAPEEGEATYQFTEGTTTTTLSYAPDGTLRTFRLTEHGQPLLESRFAGSTGQHRMGGVWTATTTEALRAPGADDNPDCNAALRTYALAVAAYGAALIAVRLVPSPLNIALATLAALVVINESANVRNRCSHEPGTA